MHLEHSLSCCFLCCLVELYWTAPELLRLEEYPFQGTQKGDVYSFAIIMKELINNNEDGPFHDLDQEAEGIT